MQTTYPQPPLAGPAFDGARPGWLRRAEIWMDERGRAAWITAMVLSFIFVWPAGLALLAYMIFNHKFSLQGRYARSKEDHMFCRNRRHAHRHDHAAFRPSGNSAFDAYKSETLRRLEEEQQAFEGFLGRLRAAKDQQEFDRFMEDRAHDAARAPSDVVEGDAPKA